MVKFFTHEIMDLLDQILLHLQFPDTKDIINYAETVALVAPSLLANYFESPTMASMIYLTYALSLKNWWGNYKYKLTNPVINANPRCFTPPPVRRYL